VGKLSSIALGIVTAIGGFIDMGELVTCAQAGAQYRFGLLWTIVVGTLGIIVYADTAGRVAIASGRALFDVIRERLGVRLGLICLAGAVLVNVLTLVVELAGVALVLQILTGLSYLWLYPLAALLVTAILWFGSFDLVENGAALLGLTILVFVVAAIKLAPPWGEVARQAVVPSIPEGQSLAAYGFSAVSLLGAFMSPYEIHFYSSGAIEEKWGADDFVVNRLTAIVGIGFGSLIAVAMMVVAAQTFFPHDLQPASFGGIRVGPVAALGGLGLVGFLVGAFATTGGAALETALSAAYSVCQFFGWAWGKNHTPKGAPVFTLSYLVAILVAMVVAFTGVDPVKLTVYTTALAAFSLPLTFGPLLLIANDERYMGEQRNGRWANLAGGFFLILLSIVTLATIPLFILSGGGGG
jgi:Mn2+/Fe2+ NRAMP family transporter